MKLKSATQTSILKTNTPIQYTVMIYQLDIYMLRNSDRKIVKVFALPD